MLWPQMTLIFCTHDFWISSRAHCSSITTMMSSNVIPKDFHNPNESQGPNLQQKRGTQSAAWYAFTSPIVLPGFICYDLWPYKLENLISSSSHYDEDLFIESWDNTVF